MMLCYHVRLQLLVHFTLSQKLFNSFQLKYLSRIEFFNTFKRDIQIFIYIKNLAVDLHLLLKKKKLCVRYVRLM